MSMVYGSKPDRPVYVLPAKWQRALVAGLDESAIIMAHDIVVTKIPASRNTRAKMTARPPALGTSSGAHGFHVYGALKSHNSRGAK